MLSSYRGYSLGCSLKKSEFSGHIFFHTKCNEWESRLGASKTTVKISIKKTNCFGMLKKTTMRCQFSQVSHGHEAIPNGEGLCFFREGDGLDKIVRLLATIFSPQV